MQIYFVKEVRKTGSPESGVGSRQVDFVQEKTFIIVQ